MSMPTQQALQERDAAQHKVQEMIAEHHAEIEDLRAQLAKVLTALNSLSAKLALCASSVSINTERR